MGKTYLNLTTGTDNITKPRNITVASPYDVRTVVDTADDLYNKTTFGYSSLYIGMLVITYDTQDVYVLSKLPNSRDNEIKWRENIQWKKVGSIDLSEYAKLTDLDRYATKDSLLNFLTASDVEDFVSVNDVANLTSEFVSQSDLDVYVKTEDLVDFVKSEDIKDFAKKEDLNDFLTSSDVLDFVKVDELNTILSEEVFSKFVSQSDLDVYVKTEDLVDFVTSSELDSRIAAIDIPEVPTNVSAFTNDAGYLTSSDVDDFVSVEELKNYATKEDIVNFVSQSDLEVYAKVVDVVELLEKEDYAKKGDLKDFLTGSDVEDFVKISDIADVVRVDDLDLYVKAEDAIEFLTASDLDGYLKVSELPTNVSAFTNDAGYLTDADLPDFLLASDLDGYVKTEDLESYIPKTELDKLATKSDLNGYVRTEDAVEFLTASDLDGFATIDKIPTAGSFPETVDSPTTTSNGFATVQDVMDYVNALIEKKKDELAPSGENKDYIYINAERFTGSETPASIYKVNCYEVDNIEPFDSYTGSLTAEGQAYLNAGKVSGTGFALEVKAAPEIYGYFDEVDPSMCIYSELLTIDIPQGYTLEVHNFDEDHYSDATEPFAVNFKGETKKYGKDTYNSYVRGTGEMYGRDSNIMNGVVRYLVILKQA